MTYSILVRDPETGALGGASATGNLCVGGWVLRGDVRAGVSASQGMAPSTLWGEDVLEAMGRGLAAEQAVAEVIATDAGRPARQLLALDRDGRGAAFTGHENVPAVSEIVGPNFVVGGNMLADAAVTAASRDGFLLSRGTMVARLLHALRVGAAAGGDARGLMSAAILIVSADAPPIDLRIDYSEAPLEDLARLLERSEAADYAAWRRTLPSRQNPEGRLSAPS